MFASTIPHVYLPISSLLNMLLPHVAAGCASTAQRMFTLLLPYAFLLVITMMPHAPVVYILDLYCIYSLASL